MPFRFIVCPKGHTSRRYVGQGVDFVSCAQCKKRIWVEDVKVVGANGQTIPLKEFQHPAPFVSKPQDVAVTKNWVFRT
jgi:hypothetical protein